MNNLFKNILKGKVVIVGIGNTMRGDDGFGPALIERLKNNVNAVCIDAGSAPENYTGKIVKEKPDIVLIVDALHLGKKPGEYEILKKDDIARCGYTTHNISPHMFIEYLKKKTGAEVFILGVQPMSLKMGNELSVPLKETLNEIERELTRCMNLV